MIFLGNVVFAVAPSWNNLKGSVIQTLPVVALSHIDVRLERQSDVSCILTLGEHSRV